MAVVTARYRAWKRGYVIDSERRDDERVVTICSRQSDAEMVARALNNQGAVTALREARPYVFNRSQGTDWRAEAAREVLERVDAAIARFEGQ